MGKPSVGMPAVRWAAASATTSHAGRWAAHRRPGRPRELSPIPDRRPKMLTPPPELPGSAASLCPSGLSLTPGHPPLDYSK